MKMYNLRYFCLVLLVAVVSKAEAVTDAQVSLIQSKFVTGGVSCFKDHPLSFSDINKLRKKMLPEGEEAKCFVQCLFQKIGIMDDMGKLSVEGARQQAMAIFKDNDQLTNVDQFMETCAKANEQEINGAGCDRAKLIFNCLVENAPKFGFNVDF